MPPVPAELGTHERIQPRSREGKRLRPQPVEQRPRDGLAAVEVVAAGVEERGGLVKGGDVVSGEAAFFCEEPYVCLGAGRAAGVAVEGSCEGVAVFA